MRKGMELALPFTAIFVVILGTIIKQEWMNGFAWALICIQFVYGIFPDIPKKLEKINKLKSDHKKELENLGEKHGKEISKLMSDNSTLTHEVSEWQSFAYRFFQDTGLKRAFDKLDWKDYVPKPKVRTSTKK